jgi:hypothetical protein
VNELPPLTFDDVRPVLVRLADVSDDLILVGGQALRFWADYYEARSPGVLPPDPLIGSQDIDFCGPVSVVRKCAERLHGEAKVATLDDATVNTGLVLFADARGDRRLIDFISEPHGLKAKEVERLAQPFEVERPDGSPVLFWVMHPVHCLESRIENLTLGKSGPHALAQLRASLVCARESLRELVEQPEHVRDVLNLNEHLFQYAQKSRAAGVSALQYGVDPFDAVLVDERLPDKFRTVRYPQMQREIARLQPKRMSECLARGRAFEQAWDRAVNTELAKLRASAATWERKVDLLLERQRERVRAHQLQRPEPSGTIVGATSLHEAALGAWQDEDRALRHRLGQLEQRAARLHDFAREPIASGPTPGTHLAAARARQSNPGLARELAAFREWKRAREAQLGQDEPKRALERDRER